MKHQLNKLKRFSLLSASFALFILYFPITIPVLIIAITCSWTGCLFSRKSLKEYGFHLALAYDRFANVAVFLGASSETISSRLGRAKLATQARWWVPGLIGIVDTLALVGFGDRDHVINSIEPGNHEDKELINWIITP